MATCIHSSRSCLLPFYTIPIFPLLNQKIFHLLVVCIDTLLVHAGSRHHTVLYFNVWAYSSTKYNSDIHILATNVHCIIYVASITLVSVHFACVS